MDCLDKSVSTRNERASQTQKKRAAQKAARWNATNNNEQEVYHTVVVNYHYSDHVNATAGSKDAMKRENNKMNITTNTLSTSSSSSATTSVERFDDVPNLAELYALPEVNETPKQQQQPQPQPQQAFCCKTSKPLERVNVSIYKVPSQQCAIVEERRTLPTLQYSEVIVLSDSDLGETETDEKMFVVEQAEKVEHPQKLQIKSKESQTNQLTTTNSTQGKSRKRRSHKLAETASANRQFQSELHQLRVAVEQKRLQLLEMKMTREQDEMERERWLFEKELQLKCAKLKRLEADSGDL